MTLKKATTITQLNIQIGPVHGYTRLFVASAFDPDTGLEVVSTQGVSPGEALELLVQANYQRVSRIVFRNQGWRCARCRKFLPLSAHHLKHRSKGRIDTVENLVALDSGCHALEHGD